MKTIKLFVIVIILVIKNSFCMIDTKSSQLPDEELLISFEEISKSSSSETLVPTLINLNSSKSDLEELAEVFEIEQIIEKRRKQILNEIKEALGE
jgi:hypothetical protein